MEFPGKFVLDPTGLYEPSQGCVLIDTERRWLEHVGRTESLCWIRGEWLCRWTTEWLRQSKSELDPILDIKKYPRPKLQAIFKNVPVPQDWDDRKVLYWVERLSSCCEEDWVLDVLSEATGTPKAFWIETPSPQHLARFLSLEIASDLNVFVCVWAESLRGRLGDDLLQFYCDADRVVVLRRWLGLDTGPCPSAKYPQDIPDSLAGEFESSWAAKITQTEGAAIDLIIPQQQCGMKRIARLAADIFRIKSDWITQSRVEKLVAFLDLNGLRVLNASIPPPVPSLLAQDASVAVALHWATSEYLPYRRWQTSNALCGEQKRLAEAAADSFVNWVIRTYPQIKHDPVVGSPLNYSVGSLVSSMSSRAPVLWVVVDGLGWLEHIELLKLLSESRRLSVTSIEPKICVLPSKTEYAKWSLYSQLLPSHHTWEPDAGKGFTSTDKAQRYTDHPARKELLGADLKNAARSVYCWDTTEYDSLFHNDTAWKHLIEVSIPQALRRIAAEIEYLVSLYVSPRDLQIIISSDHGQLMGEHERIQLEEDSGAAISGRLLHGKTQDRRFVLLDAAQFGLPEDLSVIRGAGCLSAYQLGQNGQAVGLHGGLFPEELVIGCSVLRHGVTRKPVSVLCTGQGKLKEAGTLKVEVVNPNEVPITGGLLSIAEIPELANGIAVQLHTEPFGKQTFDVPVSHWPELDVNTPGNRIRLSGEMRFKFSDVEESSTTISGESFAEVIQMFRSGLNIDEFI